MFRPICGRLRNRSTRTMRPMTSGPWARGAENLLEFVSASDLELIVAALPRRLVRPPSQENGGMAEAITLQVVVLDLAHPLYPQRLPREILPGAPPALPTRHAGHFVLACVGPFTPGVILECILAQRCQVLRELLAHGDRERGCDP